MISIKHILFLVYWIKIILIYKTEQNGKVSGLYKLRRDGAPVFGHG